MVNCLCASETPYQIQLPGSPLCSNSTCQRLVLLGVNKNQKTSPVPTEVCVGSPAIVSSTFQRALAPAATSQVQTVRVEDPDKQGPNLDAHRPIWMRAAILAVTRQGCPCPWRRSRRCQPIARDSLGVIMREAKVLAMLVATNLQAWGCFG